MMHEPLAESPLRLGVEHCPDAGVQLDEAALLEEALERKRIARDRLIVAIRRMDPEAGCFERIIPITDPRGSQCIRRDELIARMLSRSPEETRTQDEARGSHAAHVR